MAIYSIHRMSNDITRHVGRMMRDTRGSIAIVFAFLIAVLAGVAGLAVHTAEYHSLRLKLVSALDASVLAGARTYLLTHNTNSTVNAATSLFNVQMAGEPTATYNATVDPNQSMVSATATITMPTPLMSVLGHTSIELTATSKAIADPVALEVAVTVDLSSSMTGSKFTDLKVAATNMVNIINPTASGNRTRRIAFAPFAATVNVGSLYGSIVQNPLSDTCVTERNGSERLTDIAPGSGAYFEPFNNGSYECLSTEILPLSGDKYGVLNYVNNLQLSWGTAGHLGTAWAWYLISPNWTSLWPSGSQPVAYNAPDTKKVVVIMSDGEFYLKHTGGSMGSADMTRALCDGLKAASVTVYTVGFELDQQSAVDMLAYCASSPQHAQLAENGAELQQAFQSIAVALLPLRLVE